MTDGELETYLAEIEKRDRLEATSVAAVVVADALTHLILSSKTNSRELGLRMLRRLSKFQPRLRNLLGDELIRECLSSANDMPVQVGGEYYESFVGGISGEADRVLRWGAAFGLCKPFDASHCVVDVLKVAENWITFSKRIIEQTDRNELFFPSPRTVRLFVSKEFQRAKKLLPSDVIKLPEFATVAIPPEFRTKPMTLQEAAVFLGQSGDKSGGEWLSRCIEDGTIHCEELSRQSRVFDLREFPKSVHSSILPKKRTGGNLP